MLQQWKSLTTFIQVIHLLLSSYSCFHFSLHLYLYHLDNDPYSEQLTEVKTSKHILVLKQISQVLRILSTKTPLERD